ncbi:hypothetical protein [Streptomyces sp. BF23-19]|uniref:hypothetical protein n=1 Tax=unclassified Streptomyces TaxID=2593676 RepID=UPI0034E5B014
MNVTHVRPLDYEGLERVDSIILWLLAASGVLSIFLFVVRALLDQLPDIIGAWRKVQRIYQSAERNSDDPPGPDA